MVDLVGPLDRPVEFRDDAMCAAAFQLLRGFQLADQDADLAIDSLSAASWRTLRFPSR